MFGPSSTPSTMRTGHDFSRVPRAEIQRSTFDRSHSYKSTFSAGYLYPVFFDEAVPGDTFKLDLTAIVRLATPLHPIMDNLFVDTQFFAIPERLLWDNWERFNGAQDNPGDSTDYIMPYIDSPTSGGYQIGTIFDYFGIPTQIPDLRHRADFFRSYNLVWNEWYRDENLQDSVTVYTTDGPDGPGAYELLRRGKRHDYFTSCLPWPQKGPAVEIPLGSKAPVATETAPNVGNVVTVQYATDEQPYHLRSDGVNATFGALYGGGTDKELYADLSEATAATINALRLSFQIQRLYERDARGGTRYTEIIKSHFNVTSPDMRLQRPEYIGGGSTPLQVTPIVQTAPGDGVGSTPLAELAGVGSVVLRNNGFTHSFTEHCVVIGLLSIRADLNYQQGLNRMWSRSTRWDFYWPALAHLGEQAVLNKEIYAQGSLAPGEDDGVFGYQERYAEMRHKPSLCTALMRSTAPQSLDTWHLAQDFQALPVLGASFIEENPPVDRVIAVTSEPQFKADLHFRFTTTRPMPMYSVPGFIDHF